MVMEDAPLLKATSLKGRKIGLESHSAKSRRRSLSPILNEPGQGHEPHEIVMTNLAIPLPHVHKRLLDVL